MPYDAVQGCKASLSCCTVVRRSVSCLLLKAIRCKQGRVVLLLLGYRSKYRVTARIPAPQGLCCPVFLLGIAHPQCTPPPNPKARRCFCVEGVPASALQNCGFTKKQQRKNNTPKNLLTTNHPPFLFQGVWKQGVRKRVRNEGSGASSAAASRPPPPVCHRQPTCNRHSYRPLHQNGL